MADPKAAHRSSYNDVTEITTSAEVAALSERLWLGAYPTEALGYLAFVHENRVRVSVQLQMPKLPRFRCYHATAVGDIIKLALPGGAAVELHLVSVDPLDLGLEGATEAFRRVYEVSSGGGEPWTWSALAVRWPDFGVLPPAAMQALLREWGRLVDVAARTGGGERVNAHVHCMAGIGRSGTFALARVLWRTPPLEGAAAWTAPSASPVLKAMRASRPGLVETSEQLAAAVAAANALRA